MSCVLVCVDMKMSDSEGEFICSQVSKFDYESSQSAHYGVDIIDGDATDRNIVSLESGLEHEIQDSKTTRIIYDNVQIEDISSDEELDSM